MLMMSELIDMLYTEDCSMVLLHEGNIRTFKGRGVRTLYHLLNEAPESLLKSKIAVKAVGKTAARSMTEGGVVEVYADVMSQEAYAWLEDAGVKVNCEKKVDHQRFLKIWAEMGEIKD